MFSCDALDENPQAIAVETFYNTPDEIESGVNAIYPPLRENYSPNYAILQEASSDIVYGCIGSWSGSSQYDGFDSRNITRASSCWDDFYKAIRNANIMVEAIPKAKESTEDEKSLYLGEAKYLRALSYFHLVVNWGAVPLRTEENRLEYNLPRTPESDVFNLIIADLEYAETSLPSTVSVAGHPTKWSAKMLLADVNFYLNKYDKAAELTKEIIDSHKYSLVEIKTTDDFEKIYGAEVVNTPEEIFYFKYNEQSGTSIPICYHGGAIAGKYIRVGGYNLVINKDYYCEYANQNDKDLRKGLWYSYSAGLVGEHGLLLKKYNDVTGVNPRNSFPLYRYADCLLMYAEASCRVQGAPTTDGLEALNIVHRRAYGYTSTQPSSVDFQLGDYNKDSFIALCIEERGYETVGESKRWIDLKRLGKTEAAKYIKMHRGLELKDKQWLWPIPVSELNFNEAISDQNPGY